MMSWNDPRREYARSCARAIVKELDIREPYEIDVELIAAHYGAFVSETNMNGCDGRLLRRGPTGFIEVRRQILEQAKKRFVVAHELGHFVLHVDRDQSRCFLDKSLMYWYAKVNPEEMEANEFACELLMPEGMFRRLSTDIPTFAGIDFLGDVFNTSLTATAMRYIELTPYDCALVCTEGGQRKWFRASEDFPFKITLGALDPHSNAADFLNGQPNPKMMQDTTASAWLNGPGLGRLKSIREESRVLSRYGKMLTLLCVELDDAPAYEEDEEEEERSAFSYGRLRSPGGGWRRL